MDKGHVVRAGVGAGKAAGGAVVDARRRAATHPGRAVHAAAAASARLHVRRLFYLLLGTTLVRGGAVYRRVTYRHNGRVVCPLSLSCAWFLSPPTRHPPPHLQHCPSPVLRLSTLLCCAVRRHQRQLALQQRWKALTTRPRPLPLSSSSARPTVRR